GVFVAPVAGAAHPRPPSGRGYRRLRLLPTAPATEPGAGLGPQHLLECSGERGDVGVRQVAREVVVDAAQVDSRRFAQASRAGARQDGEGAAAVVLTALPFDETGPGHPVDEPGQPAPAEEHPVGEVLHAQPSAGVREADQDVVPGQWELAFRLELGLERADDGGVGAHERPPGVEALGADPDSCWYRGRSGSGRHAPTLPAVVALTMIVRAIILRA